MSDVSRHERCSTIFAVEQDPGMAASSPGTVTRQPAWVRELVLETDAARVAVVEHEAWRAMREGTISRPLHRLMLVGFWPLIESFPKFLALNILKTTHGAHPAEDAARFWLARNLRAEARHAEW